MSTTCVVCNVNSFGMIGIYKHPNKLDVLLNFVSNHKVQETDHLCINCYDDLKSAANFKQKCMQSPLYCESEECANAPTQTEEMEYPEEESISNEVVTNGQSTPETPISQDHHNHENGTSSNSNFLITDVRVCQEFKSEQIVHISSPYRDPELTENADESPVLDESVAELTQYIFDPDTIDLIDENGIDPIGTNRPAHDIVKHEAIEEDFAEEIDSNSVIEISDDISCCFCDRTFADRYIFYNHLREHLQEQEERRKKSKKQLQTDFYKTLSSTQCEYCFVRFNDAISLGAHKVQHNHEARPYRCNQLNCVIRASQRWRMRNHINTHSEKKFKCSQCDMEFNQRENCQLHERTHSLRKPFECGICRQKFNLSDDVQGHLMQHAADQSSNFIETFMDRNRFAKQQRRTQRK